MRGLRRIVRTAGAVTAVIIGSAISTVASTVTHECTDATAGKAIEFAATETEVKFKCGTGFTGGFFPNDLKQVYTDANSSSYVALRSVVPNASLTKTSDKVYTLAVRHSTYVTADQTLYYYCKKNDNSGTCKITVTMKVREMKPAITCNKTEQERMFMTDEEKSVKFACGTDYKELLPDLQNTYVSDSDKVAPLSDIYPGASLTKDSNTEDVYTLNISERQATKVVRFRCKKAASDVCEVYITVVKNKSAPTDGLMAAATCTGTQTKVDLTLSEESPGIAFACGLDVPKITPPELEKVNVKGETGTQLLKTLYKKAALYTNPALAANVYFLYIPFREVKRELTYTCKDDKTTTCAVNITVEANKGVIPVCRDAAKGAHLSYEDFDESVKFKCDAAFPNIFPSDVAQVYTEDPTVVSKAEAVVLDKLYGGAKLVSDGDSKSPTFTLTIPPHLPREFDNIYYQCKKDDDTRCTVRIRVAKKEQEMRTCGAGQETKVTITGPGEIVRFKCGTGLSLRPADLKEVYDDADSKCSNAANLTDLIPEATIQTDSEDKDGKVITFKKLPVKDQALCYSCSAEDTTSPALSFRAPQTAKQCKVMIKVESAALGLSAQTLVGHALMLVSLVGAVLSSL